MSPYCSMYLLNNLLNTSQLIRWYRIYLKLWIIRHQTSKASSSIIYMFLSLQYIDKVNVPSTPYSKIAVINEKVYGNESAYIFIYLEIVLELIAGPDIPTILFVEGASILLPPFLCTMKNILFLALPPSNSFWVSYTNSVHFFVTLIP